MSVSVFILPGREADALACVTSCDVQVWRTDDQLTVISIKTDELGRISAGARPTVDALFAAGVIAARGVAPVGDRSNAFQTG